MKLENNTILITGGSSGIGLELSRVLLAQNNKVIICGRSESKLQEAKELYPQLITYQCDISSKEQCQNLSEWIHSNHADLNVLVNNAAIVHKTSFIETDNIVEMAEAELKTNFLAPVRLIKLLYPVLEKHLNPAIINVTTGLVYTPRAEYPFYNATKAAEHSFTQMLRWQLQNSKVKVVEAMFPAVDTPWHKGNPPKIAIPVERAVKEMIAGLQKDKVEIRIGGVKLLYRISRIAPKFAFKKVNSLERE